MASLEGFEPTTRCLEVIQRACFLLTLKLNCCFVSILVLASKYSFPPHLYESISAKLVPELKQISNYSKLTTFHWPVVDVLNGRLFLIKGFISSKIALNSFCAFTILAVSFGLALPSFFLAVVIAHPLPHYLAIVALNE
jgi:hypothetical protein